jgi:hypothetical protein
MLLFCLGFHSALASAAEISAYFGHGVLDPRLFGNMVTIEGTIEPGDFDRLKALIATQGWLGNGAPEYVRLGPSPGGDLREAMKIGRLIRSLFLRTEIYDVCASACVYLAIAGVEREPVAPKEREHIIGLHRPYFSGTEFGELAPGDAKNIYASLLEDAKDYLVSVGAPLDFVDESFKYSSRDALWLSGPEFLSRVGRADAAVEEWLINRCDYLPWPKVVHARHAKWSIDHMDEVESAAQYVDAYQFTQERAYQLYKRASDYAGCRSMAVARAMVGGFENAIRDSTE